MDTRNREKVVQAVPERRENPRWQPAARITVHGVNANSEAFTEFCELTDISQGGICWSMEAPLWVDTLLVVELFYPHPVEPHPVLRRKGTARVLRIEEGAGGRYQVAACFEGLASFTSEHLGYPRASAEVDRGRPTG